MCFLLWAFHGHNPKSNRMELSKLRESNVQQRGSESYNCVFIVFFPFLSILEGRSDSFHDERVDRQKLRDVDEGLVRSIKRI